MSYIKINKDYLDYDYYAYLHSFTFNNFVRNVMRHGKYKKAVRIVRRGLIEALKEIRRTLESDYLQDEGIRLNYEHLPKKYLQEDTKNLIELKLKKSESFNNIKKLKYAECSTLEMPNLKPSSQKFVSAQKFLEQLNNFKKDNLVLQLRAKQVKGLRKRKCIRIVKKLERNNKFSFFNYFEEFEHKLSDKTALMPRLNKYKLTRDNVLVKKNKKLETRLNAQFNFLSIKLNFRKIYTKSGRMRYVRNRQYTVFDMVSGVYNSLANIWYLKKMKASGRTVLVPTPLRPYRRITSVTKMIMSGLKIRRRKERFEKTAMINSIKQEFHHLVVYYDANNPFPTITVSWIWQNKLQSHKDLVTNLKNMKYSKYI